MNKSGSPAYFLTLALMACAAQPVFAQSATYPDRPIRFIVPFPPGGLTDNSARVIGEKLGTRLGQQIIFDNRSGAAGNIGTQLAAQAAPDGYTLLVGPDSTLAVNPNIYPKMPFDALRDFAPISLLGVINMTVVAHPSFSVRNLRELVALAIENPVRSRTGRRASVPPVTWLSSCCACVPASISRTSPTKVVDRP